MRSLAASRRDVALVTMGGRPVLAVVRRCRRCSSPGESTAQPVSVDGAERLVSCRLARAIARCPIARARRGVPVLMDPVPMNGRAYNWLIGMSAAFATSNLARTAIAFATSLRGRPRAGRRRFRALDALHRLGGGADDGGRFRIRRVADPRCGARRPSIGRAVAVAFVVRHRRARCRSRSCFCSFPLRLPRMLGTAAGLQDRSAIALAGAAYGCLAAVFRAGRARWCWRWPSRPPVRWSNGRLHGGWSGRGTGIAALLVLAAAVQAMQLAAAAVVWLRLAGSRTGIEWPSPAATLVATMREAWPFAAAGLIANAQLRLAPVLLGFMASPAALAAFGVASRIGGLARMLPQAAFAGALPVLVARSAAWAGRTMSAPGSTGYSLAFAHRGRLGRRVFAGPRCRGPTAEGSRRHRAAGLDRDWARTDAREQRAEGVPLRLRPGRGGRASGARSRLRCRRRMCRADPVIWRGRRGGGACGWAKRRSGGRYTRLAYSRVNSAAQSSRHRGRQPTRGLRRPAAAALPGRSAGSTIASARACGIRHRHRARALGAPSRRDSRPRADDWHARRRGLERDDARGFVAGRQHEQMCSTIQCGDDVRSAARRGTSRDRRAPWRLTASLQPRRSSCPRRPDRDARRQADRRRAKRLDECAMIFHWIQVRDVQQPPGRAVGRPRRG